jgi:uncharacterized protein YciI
MPTRYLQVKNAAGSTAAPGRSACGDGLDAFILSRVRGAISALTVALSLAFFAASAKAADPIQWGFLNTGAGRSKTKGMSQEELSKMQAAHVGNFGNLFNEGRLFAAGPLGDNGWIRGIVVLNTPTEAKAHECFQADPFVQNSILDVELHPWRVDIMKFCTPKVPFQLAQHTLCIVKRGKNWSEARAGSGDDGLLKLFPSLKSQARSGELAISGPFLDTGDKLGVLLFFSTNRAEIQAGLEKEPAVARGRVEFELHPQFLGAGTFKDPKVSNTPPKPGKRVRLFDGRRFDGWEGDTQRTWRIERGALVGGSLTQTVPHNEFLCTTQEFKNFDLRLKVKLTGAGSANAGIQFRSQRSQDPAYEVIGYQADMGEGYWGSLYDESRRNKTLAHTYTAIISRILKPSDWNEYIIRCENNHVRLWLNGRLTVDYTENDSAIPLAGLIGLQIHGGGKAEASYRDITIEELP